MFNETNQEIIKKAIEVAPDWLHTDIEKIIERNNPHVRLSEVISELFKQYSFNITHILSAMHANAEWTQISRERLNYIDNNIDLIEYMLKEKKKNLEN